jgi:Pre ATP-grasp domain
MPKIIVMNAATEQMSGRDLTSTQQLLAAKTAWRSSWFADAGDIIVTPVPIKENFLAYIGRTLGFDPTSVSIITLDQRRHDPAVLTDEELLSPEIIGALQIRTNGSDHWAITPCYHTEGVTEIASMLGIAEPAGHRFAAQRGCDILNRKSHFRQLAAEADLPLADGSIADTPDTRKSNSKALAPYRNGNRES